MIYTLKVEMNVIELKCTQWCTRESERTVFKNLIVLVDGLYLLNSREDKT